MVGSEILVAAARSEFDAIDDLAETPCASDAEFVEKLRYLLAHETRIFEGPPDGNHDFGSIVIAVDRHLNRAA